jgi:hypothetical protein
LEARFSSQRHATMPSATRLRASQYMPKPAVPNRASTIPAMNSNTVPQPASVPFSQPSVEGRKVSSGVSVMGDLPRNSGRG